jgi:thioesterase domain-containing protein/acyl carrier protein
VSALHELSIRTVSLLEPGQLPKTSSGKIARRPTREEFLAGRLGEVARFTQAWPEEPPGQTLGQTPGQTPGEPSGETGDAKQQDAPPPPPSARTREDLVAWLSSFLSRRLRLAQGAVAPERPFLELGLDSKEAVAIAGELASALGRPVSATALYDFPCITALAQHLAEPAVRPAPLPPDSARTAEGSAGSAAPGCVVLLSGGGSGRPLFLIPGLFGVLSAFSQLARELSGHMPLWGLDLPVHRGLPQPASVPALAARYAEELCAMPDAEPYRLLGYCSGGMVGLEVARQLRQRGRVVETLLLLDAPYLDALRTDLSQLRKETQLAGERHAQLTLAQAVRLTVRYILGKQWAFGEGEELAEQMVRGGTANLSTFQGYEPQPLSVRATLISARERIRIPMYEEDADKNAQRWSQLLLDGSLTQLSVSGNHHTMLQPPHVRELAQRLLAELSTEAPARPR